MTLKEKQMAATIPDVPIRLELHPSINDRTRHNESLNQAIQHAITQTISELLATLGIPGIPLVTFTAVPSGRSTRNLLLQMFVHGAPCRYPDELLRFVYSYVHQTYPDPEVAPAKLIAWVTEVVDSETESSSQAVETVIEFLALLCQEILKRKPSVLLGSAQEEAYIAALPVSAESPLWPPDARQLRPILSQVLDLKLSIADRERVAEVLGQSNEKQPEDVVEDLISALSPDVVEILLPQSYLKQLTDTDPGNEAGLIPFMRDRLFVELGINYPAFRFVVTEQLKPRTFAFRINHLMTLPLQALEMDQCLINEVASRVSLMNITATAATNPATGMAASITALDHQEYLESVGLTTWNPWGFLILAFAQVLRAHGICFMHRRATEALLDRFSWHFPATVKAVRSQVSLTQLTRLLRSLVAEEISIRNLRLILERLLEHELIAKNSPFFGADSNPDTLPREAKQGRPESDRQLAFVRAGLKRQIGFKYARGTQTLVVYLLDRDIEQTLLRQQSLPGEGGDERDQARIIEAIHGEITYLPPTAQVPVILTTDESRPLLRKLVEMELPRMSIIAYGEIPPDLNIQPVARISIS
jgi:type III secretory pathway component EscV